MPNVQIHPSAPFPKMHDPTAQAIVNLGPGIRAVFQIDPRVNPGDWLFFTIFQAITNIEKQIADVETVIANLPGCGRPIEGLPSLVVATDAMRAALASIHDRVDARAPSEPPPDPNVAE